MATRPFPVTPGIQVRLVTQDIQDPVFPATVVILVPAHRAIPATRANLAIRLYRAIAGIVPHPAILVIQVSPVTPATADLALQGTQVTAVSAPLVIADTHRPPDTAGIAVSAGTRDTPASPGIQEVECPAIAVIPASELRVIPATHPYQAIVVTHPHQVIVGTAASRVTPVRGYQGIAAIVGLGHQGILATAETVDIPDIVPPRVIQAIHPCPAIQGTVEFPGTVPHQDTPVTVDPVYLDTVDIVVLVLLVIRDTQVPVVQLVMSSGPHEHPTRSSAQQTTAHSLT